MASNCDSSPAFKRGEDGELDGMRLLRTGEYELSLPISSDFFEYIIGKNGHTLRSIEEDTQTEIKIPRARGQSIVIIGQSKRSLVLAKQRIERIVRSVKMEDGITHFLGIPLNLSSVMENFEEFKTSVLAERFPGIDEELFQKSVKLHLTLPVFYLFNEEEERMVIEEIRKVLPRAITKLSPMPSPHSILIKGLGCMNNNPSSMKVLYGKVALSDGSNKLQDFVDCLQDELSTALHADYIQLRGREGIRLHVTVMNSSFRDRRCFDGRPILEEYGDYDFGSVVLSKVCLLKKCERDTNGFYRTVETFDIV